MIGPILQADPALSLHTGCNTAQCTVVLSQLRVPQPHYGPRPGHLPRLLVEEHSVHQYPVPSQGYGKSQEIKKEKHPTLLRNSRANNLYVT